MEMRERTIGPLVLPTADDRVAPVDFRAFVCRLVLSEQVLVQGVAGLEQLVEKFGFDGMSELLRSGRLRVIYDFVTVGQTGQLTALNERVRRGLLPLGSYSLSVVRPTDFKGQVHDGLSAIDRVPGLHGKEAQKLRHLVSERFMPVDPQRGVAALADAKRSIEQDPTLLGRAVILGAAKHHGLTIDPATLRISAASLNDDDFAVQTNLREVLNLDAETEHKVVERGVLGIGGLHQKLEDMQRYNAIGGLQTDELPLFEQKLSFLAAQLDPDSQTDRFWRVVQILGLPHVDPSSQVRDVDLSRLVEVVHTVEAEEFRRWLRASDDWTDGAIKEHFHPVHEKLAHAIHGPAGKAVRFMATTGAGFVPIPGIGIGLSALDTFVTDRLVREDGPSAFVGRLYPSVFRS